MTQTRDGADRRRSIPNVEKLISAGFCDIPDGHALLVAAARQVLAAERARLAKDEVPRSLDELRDTVLLRLEAERLALPAAINASGIIIHTNLGRVPWSERAIAVAMDAARGHLLLEVDRETGRRARRLPVAEQYLTELTGAEDALATNNNAAAVALAVRLGGRGSGVAVARGELIEIGGGVRIPEIIKRAGARLVEVGTTNKTRLADFEDVLRAATAKLILHVHASNFRMEGFVESPSLHELGELAARYEVPLVDDLGSGALLDTQAFGLAHEPTPRESLAAGASLVTFSGDKLVGGPQAGLVVGRSALIKRLRRDPLARATRLDKVSLAALAATLDAYRRGTATTELPVWRMISMAPGALEVRARTLHASLTSSTDPASVRVAAMESAVGGGSLPGQTLPSVGLAIATRHPALVALALRRHRPAIVGRIADGELLLDLRTVAPEEDAMLGKAVASVLARV